MLKFDSNVSSRNIEKCYLGLKGRFIYVKCKIIRIVNRYTMRFLKVKRNSDTDKKFSTNNRC